MTLTEYRMLIDDLAAQAEIRYNIEAGDAGQNRDRNEVKLLEEYRNSMVALSRRLKEMLENDQPADQAGYLAMMHQISSTHGKLNQLRGVSPAFVTSQVEKMKSLEAVASRVDPAGKITLKGAAADPGDRVVRLDSDPEYMGDVSSQRYMVKVKRSDGTEVEGFFTRDRGLFEFDPHGVVRDLLAEARKKHGQDPLLCQFVEKVLRSRHKSSSLLLCTETKGRNKEKKELNEKIRAKKSPAKPVEMLDGYEVEVMRGLGLIDDKAGLTLDAIKGNRNIMRLLRKVRSTITEDEVSHIAAELAQYHGVIETGIGGEPGSAKAGRNYALSKVAALLGASHVIAKAEPITAEYGGHHYTGIFMEKGEGTCFEKTGSKAMLSDLKRMKEDSFGPRARKQLAEIQIIDYICQNVDRHTGNFLIKLDAEGRVDRITGIDNDLSFGTQILENDKKIQNSVPLNQIMVIPEEMAKIIRETDPQLLMGVLSDTGLTQREILAAAERFEKLQDHLRKNTIPGDKGVVFGKIIAVGEKDWGKHSMSDLGVVLIGDGKGYSANVNNLFVRANRIEDRMLRWKAEAASEDQFKLKIGELLQARDRERERRIRAGLSPQPEFRDSGEEKPLSANGWNAHRDALKQYLNRFSNTEHRLQRTHRQYTSMTEELQELAKLEELATGRSLSDPEFPKNMTLADCLAYEDRLSCLEKKVNAYISYKEPRRDTGLVAATRLKEAKDLAEYLKNYRESLREAYNRKVEAEMEEDYKAYTEERSKIDRIAHAIVAGIRRAAPVSAMNRLTARMSVEDLERFVCTSDIFLSMTDPETEIQPGEKQSRLDYYDQLAEEDPEKVFEAYKAGVMADREKAAGEMDAPVEKAPEACPANPSPEKAFGPEIRIP